MTTLSPNANQGTSTIPLPLPPCERLLSKQPARRYDAATNMSDNALYENLASSLRERLAIIADRQLYEQDPTMHLERLKSVSAQLSALQAQLPRRADPQLEHFLERCSYDKALAHVERALRQ